MTAKVKYKRTPPPGTARATIRGCICPRPANGTPQRLWPRIFTAGCKLHDPPVKSRSSKKKSLEIFAEESPVDYAISASEELFDLEVDNFKKAMFKTTGWVSSGTNLPSATFQPITAESVPQPAPAQPSHNCWNFVTSAGYCFACGKTLTPPFLTGPQSGETNGG